MTERPEYYSYPSYVREKWILIISDLFREHCPGSDAMARLAVERIATSRPAVEASAREQGRRGVAWIVRHLVHPDEVTLLRRLYGTHFFLITVFESLDERQEGLVTRYREPGYSFVTREKALEHATCVIKLDASAPYSEIDIDSSFEVNSTYRPNLQATFPHGDLFLGIKNRQLEDRSRAKIAQIVAQIVGYPFSTPDVHESGMAAAYQARVSSASLGRQVGAAIVSSCDDLLATGWNDVPAAGGGVYIQHYSNLEFLRDCGLDDLSDDYPDYRDHAEAPDGSRYGDSNLKIRYEILADLLERLETAGILEGHELDNLVSQRKGRWRERLKAGDLTDADVDELENELDLSIFMWQAVALSADSNMRGSKLSAILEYGRSVHAEMNAITTAARTGIQLRGATLYCTTFPCHECARHIIATGIKRVLYIEPFPKSRVLELHADAVVSSDEMIESDVAEPLDKRLGFYPFIGISPRRHEELFAMVDRKRVDQTSSDEEAALSPPEVWARASWRLSDGAIRPAFDRDEHEAEMRANHEHVSVARWASDIDRVVRKFFEDHPELLDAVDRDSTVRSKD